MLRVVGGRQHCCQPLPRRRFLEIGSASLFGLTLPQLLRAEQQPHSAGKLRAKRSVILIWQHGGPSQLDTFDMKPEAPSEVRGPFRGMASSMDGLPICELMPYHAQIMHHTTVIRSFTHGNGDHWAAAHWLLTGRLGANGSDRAPRQPSMGAIASHLLGPRSPGVPAGVNMNDGGFGFHGGAWLGVAHNPFRVGEFSYGNEAGRLPTGDAKSFELVDGLSEDRVMDRLSLLRQFDRLRAEVDVTGSFASMDDMNQQAQDIVLSGRARKAFDLSQEPQSVRERYGDGWGEQALLARRLIEAGVRFVTLNTGYWDDHGQIERALRDKLPRHDRAVGVLIADLAERGMLDDVLVVSAGEFGRTPTINKDAGRDHWPQAQSILIAGGGYKHNQIIGSTNSKAEYPTSDPFRPEDFCATIYHALGLSPTHTITDFNGRPQHLVPAGEVPRQLI
jgi:hypothetical protein